MVDKELIEKAKEELKRSILTPTDIVTTSPPDFVLALRKAPTGEVGIIAVNPEKVVREKTITGEGFYIWQGDVPKLIEKLKEVL